VITRANFTILLLNRTVFWYISDTRYLISFRGTCKQQRMATVSHYRTTVHAKTAFYKILKRHYSYAGNFASDFTTANQKKNTFRVPQPMQ